MAITVKYVAVGKWKTNAYLVEINGESIIIDPGDEFDLLDKTFQSNQYTYKCILNTHGHFDHVGAVEAFKNKYKIPFYLHGKEKSILRQSNIMRKFAGIDGFIQIPEIDFHLEEFDSIKIGGKQINILHTPGHTPGSVTFKIDKMLFSGDLFFRNQLGRTDLPGGNRTQLLDSIIFIFDNYAGCTVYPGHETPFELNGEVIDKLKSLIQ